MSFLSAVLILYWSGFTTLANVFTATFIGLPIFTCYYTWKRGWTSPLAGGIIGAVFFCLWIWVAYAGGWVLTASAGQSPGGWSFPVYDIAFSVLVVAFCGALWAVSNAEGRQHIRATWWLIWLLLASLSLSYFGTYGPLQNPPIEFPWGIVIELLIGILAYVWAVRAGFETEEIKDIADSYERQHGAA